MSEAEFDDFYTASFSRLVGHLYVMLGSFAEAQDCVQEAFVRAWDHRATLAGVQAPEAWVRQVAWRVAVSRWRRAKRGPLTEGQKREFKTVTLGLWGVTSLPPALGQVSTLLVAVILGPEAAGAIFVADRTTRFVALALNGINQALAPQISSAFYSGDRAHVQRITNLAALGSFAIALCVLAAFWIFGGFILSMFNPTYDTPTMRATLVIFGIGATFATACGPIEILLQLTGLQHALFKVLVVVNILGLGATAVTTYFFGPIGAAVSIAGTVIAWTAIAVSIARRRIGINPSVFGFAMARAAPVPSVMLKGRT